MPHATAEDAENAAGTAISPLLTGLEMARSLVEILEELTNGSSTSESYRWPKMSTRRLVESSNPAYQNIQAETQQIRRDMEYAQSLTGLARTLKLADIRQSINANQRRIDNAMLDATRDASPGDIASSFGNLRSGASPQSTTKTSLMESDPLAGDIKSRFASLRRS